MLRHPAHIGLLHSTMDDLPVGALNRTRTNRITTSLEEGVVNHFETALEVEAGIVEHSGLFVPL
jgi:hypothetical protein